MCLEQLAALDEERKFIGRQLDVGGLDTFTVPEFRKCSLGEFFMENAHPSAVPIKYFCGVSPPIYEEEKVAAE